MLHLCQHGSPQKSQVRENIEASYDETSAEKIMKMFSLFLLSVWSIVLGVLCWVLGTVFVGALILVWFVFALAFNVYACCFLPKESSSSSNLDDSFERLCLHYEFRRVVVPVTIDVSPFPINVHCVIKYPTSKTPHRTVVFVHGTLSSSATFFEIMKRCPPNTKCIAIDLPKFGISDSFSITGIPNITVCDAFADVIASVVSTLGNHQVFLVGHSLGAMFCVSVAHKYPALVKSLLLLSPAGLIPTLGVHGYYWALFFKLGAPSSLADSWFFRFMFKPVAFFVFDDSFISQFWCNFVRNRHATGHELLQNFITMRPFHAYWNTPVISRLLLLNCKVDICFGSADTIIPPHMGPFFEELTSGNFQHHVIADAFHSPWSSIEPFMQYFLRVLEACVVPTDLSHKFDERSVKETQARSMSSRFKNSYHSFALTQLSIDGTYCIFKTLQIVPRSVQKST